MTSRTKPALRRADGKEDRTRRTDGWTDERRRPRASHTQDGRTSEEDSGQFTHRTDGRAGRRTFHTQDPAHQTRTKGHPKLRSVLFSYPTVNFVVTTFRRSIKQIHNAKIIVAHLPGNQPFAQQHVNQIHKNRGSKFSHFCIHINKSNHYGPDKRT